MKVVLINSPALYLIEPHSHAPMGIMYLSAILKANGIDCEIYNLIATKYEDIELPEDVYWFGITSTSLDYPSSLKVKDIIRKQRPGIPVVIGGSHAAVFGEELLKDGWDYVVRGEMETKILDFHYMVSDRVKLGSLFIGEKLEDLDSIPYPDREGIDVIGGNVFIDCERYTDKPVPTTCINFSRGCPYNCAFCSIKSVMTRGTRYRFPNGVKGEIKYCMEKFGIVEYRLIDDCFNANLGKMFDILDAIKDLGIYWKASFTVRQNISVEMFERLYNSGCRELAFGVESADQHVLIMLNKTQTVEQSKQALINAHSAGIKTKILMMMGTPGEVDGTLQKNIDFCELVPHTKVSLKRFVPMPGSPIYDYPEKFECRIINHDWNEYNVSHFKRNDDGDIVPVEHTPMIECESITPEKQMHNLEVMFAYLQNRGDTMWGIQGRA